MHKRRQSYWDDTLVDVSVVSGGQVSFGLSLTPGDLSEGFTLVRTLVHLSMVANTVDGSAQGRMAVDYGIGLATKEAVAGAVLPDPNTNVEAPMGDWVDRDRLVVSDDNQTLNVPMEVRKDIRAGRRLGSGQMFFIAHSLNVVGTGFTVEIIGVVRMLILRP